MEPHESRPVPVPEPLRRGALTGTALIAGLTVLTFVISAVTGRPVSGSWIAVVTLVPLAGLAIYTKGFTSAPAWALRGSFVVLVAGLVMPS